MTYAKKFGKYGIYTDGMLYKWFKDLDNAIAYWESNFTEPDCKEEWLEEYSEVRLVNMKNGDILCELD